MDYKLRIDFDVCQELDGCNEYCNKANPQFKDVWGGVVTVTERSYNDDDMRTAICNLVNSCPHKAIKLIPCPLHEDIQVVQ